METINFRDFMTGDYKKERKLDVNVLSLTGVSISSLLDFPPFVAKAYTIVIVVGIVAIGLAAVEDRFSSVGMFEIAGTIMGFLKMVLPFAFYALLIYFILTNPLL